ncbi:MAG: hypothetical protein P4L31_00205 [Candidatus Babeliales bacterium]|nr:hypothetical protein [Candidatus Babeliales bacterium]
MNFFLSIFFIMSVCCASELHSAISMVYNLRIAETTKRQSAEEMFNKLSTPVLTLFEQWRKKGPDTHEFIGGGLASYIALLNPFYFRVDFAVAHASQKSTDLFFARTQTDDLLISAGYDYSLSALTRFTFSGLLGIPTHKDGVLQGVQFGYGHVGIGGQLDGSFTFAHHMDQSIRSAVRYIRFVPRGITDCVENQQLHYTFNVGNLMDLFVAWHDKVGNSRWECGYNPSFLFGAKITPDDSLFIKANNYIRNSFYGNYKYCFLINHIANAVQATASYGFDIRPKIVGRSQIINIWGSWIVNF